MRYVAAYMLAALGGNSNPSANDLKAILDSVGVEVEDCNLTQVISQLKGKSLPELMAEGQTKLASVPSGGAVAASGGSGAAAADDKPAEEAKKVESEEESDDDMGFGLFD